MITSRDFVKVADNVTCEDLMYIGIPEDDARWFTRPYSAGYVYEVLPDGCCEVKLLKETWFVPSELLQVSGNEELAFHVEA